MLQIKNVSKRYVTGNLTQEALKKITLNFRDCEFVSILGPSGSGKTTLLNIIGGLDRYTDGDLSINGVSAKSYGDKDWDAYRNHTIGFVFQSYNLIPHQTVLGNVELALTIGGISRKERTKRATDALTKVGLSDQLHKKPNQLSGGQMQRVAITRALVNDPKILLADEPTGALDSETGIQVMELLREVAKDRLVVMVTHNPELAEQYSTRIIKLKDGKIVDDSDPYVIKNEVTSTTSNKKQRSKMSFWTSLLLSFNNLRSKKGRTILTSVAGSIGIIGIALIIALSSGANAYISGIQRETMTSYPITINQTSVDIGNMAGGMRGQQMGGLSGKTDKDNSDRSGVYADTSANSSSTRYTTTNNLEAFKKYLNNPQSEINKYLGENGIVYSYDVKFDVYSYDDDGTLVNADNDSANNVDGTQFGGGKNPLSSASTSDGSNKYFQELLPDSKGALISPMVTDNYDLLAGKWPQNYNEAVLVLDENNAIPLDALYRLGLLTATTYNEAIDNINNKKYAEIVLDYDEVLRHKFYIVPSYNRYIDENDDGVFEYIEESVLIYDKLLNSSISLSVCGIIRLKNDAKTETVSSVVGYTSDLTKRIITDGNNSAVITAQEGAPNTNVLNGIAFTAETDEKRIADAKKYLSDLSVSDKAKMYKLLVASTIKPSEPIPSDEVSAAKALNDYIADNPNRDVLISVYEQYVVGATYEDNMNKFGKISLDKPSSISIYIDSFDAKQARAACIEQYNQVAPDDEKISYTDYVALLTSSLTEMINMISYVLIAFVAVSLVVSCIMIGIITHISVLERTKEIGVLRALGASKGNISQVFNAETILIGLFSGLLGVSVSALLCIPINVVLATLLGVEGLNASLSVGTVLVLIALSVAITLVGGFFHTQNAAKKDPVVALRTE